MDYKQALAILGLAEGFTADELKKKYRELSMKWHPDKGGDEEMMKQVNVAYETLKNKTTNAQKETSNEKSNQYYELKRKLEVYRSKRNYAPGTLEHKYAEEINKAINNFNIIYKYAPMSYFDCLRIITDLFSDYKNKFCQDIPKSFLEKYSNINEMCPFDEYVQRLEKIKNEYKKIETTLDDIINSIDRKLNIKVIKKINEVRDMTLKEIIDGKISLQDGTYILRCTIMQIIAKQDGLEPKINETYKSLVNNFSARMLELNYKDTDQIRIATKVFEEALKMLSLIENGTLKEDMLSTLKKLTFKDKDELQKSDDDKLYITRDGNGKPEFIFKESEVGDVVSFYRKANYYGEIVARKYDSNKEYFYDKYMSLKEYLAQAKFINKCVYEGVNVVEIQLYSLGNVTIYLDGCHDIWSIEVNPTSGVPTTDNYYTEKYGTKYKDKQVLIDEIYQSFIELIGPLHKEKHKEKTK